MILPSHAVDLSLSITSGRSKAGRIAEVVTRASSTYARARAVILAALSVATALVADARALLSCALSSEGLGGLGRRVR